jgi:sporulation protein YlmC with PRC-barrel domain
MAAPQAPSVIRAVELQGLQLRTTGGRRLGRLFDLKAAPAAGALVAELVYGELGWLERVGFRNVRAQSLPWSAVRGIEDGVILVDEAASS